MPVRYLDAAEIRRRLDPAGAVAAIERALRDGVDPARDPARTVLEVAHGHLLLMPSESAAGVGVKLAAVAPGNPAAGLARIQAVYVLFDPDTLVPRAFLDGAALTALRTPAVSVAAVRSALPSHPLRVVVFGRGPQGVGHVDTLAAVAELAEVSYLGRGEDATTALAAADVVVCATTARNPVFDSAPVRDDTVVIAVGAHEPEARELDSALLGQAQVIVEDCATALRESGNVLYAIADGVLDESRLVGMSDVVTGTVALARDRPVVFSSSGMAWEDLAVAAAVLQS